MSSEKTGQILNAFCIDLEEWFHVCEASTPYDDPKTWDSAASHVVKDTEVILRLLDEAKAHATFLTVGWVAERHPELIRGSTMRAMRSAATPTSIAWCIR